MKRGHTLLEESLKKGAAALTARDQVRAEEAFTLAGTIAADDPRVAAGRKRAAALPEISALMRQGRNHELAESWSQAADTYERVKALDPATSGLEGALARVAEGRKQTRVQKLLSQGFAFLDAERFDKARGAFRDALALEPGNAVAEGGLEQVVKRADVARINILKEQAGQAAAEERWEDAGSLYGKVLELDSTIQFALSGRALADSQQRARAALDKIIESPERLSSDKLYRDARQILASAADLEPRGDKLASRIEDVRAILASYANPVAVILRSDNLTEVTLSTVGTLGSFEEKRLELRPGAYTVIGSRDGCRDVREQIVVRPNMNPVDIRCLETL
jgi:tetratricopeptide (TPR) repeat protein